MPVTVTGVGGLPHVDADAAAVFVLDTTDVPYLPQLPMRHPEERLLAQWGDGIAGCGADPDGIGLRHGVPLGPRREAFGGAAAMLDALTTGTGTVKTQATGPVTLAMGLLAAGHPGPGLWDAVTEGLVGRIGAHVLSVEARVPGTRAIVVLDEPALSGIGEAGFPISVADARNVLATVLSGVNAPTGVHCCAPTDWGMLAGLRPDWLSWDVAGLGPGFAAHATELAEAIAAGTRIMWGVVPAGLPPLPSDEELLARLRRVEGTLILAGAPAAAMEADRWLTPSCGLAGLTIDHAAQVMGRVRDLGGAVHASL